MGTCALFALCGISSARGEAGVAVSAPTEAGWLRPPPGENTRFRHRGAHKPSANYILVTRLLGVGGGAGHAISACAMFIDAHERVEVGGRGLGTVVVTSWRHNKEAKNV